jgi:hypothetical protein
MVRAVVLFLLLAVLAAAPAIFAQRGVPGGIRHGVTPHGGPWGVTGGGSGSVYSGSVLRASPSLGASPSLRTGESRGEGSAVSGTEAGDGDRRTGLRQAILQGSGRHTTVYYAERDVGLGAFGLHLVPRSAGRLHELGLIVRVDIPGLLVATSNFANPARPETYSVETRESVRLADLVATIDRDTVTPWESHVATNAERIEAAAEAHVRFILDPSVFEDPIHANIDIDAAQNVFVLDGRNQLRLVRRLWNRKDGYGPAMVEYLPNVWAHATDRGAPDYIASLAGLPFRRGDFRVLSLVTNSTTNRTISERLKDVHVPFDFSSRDALLAGLRRHRGKHLFVVGHIEGDAFRVYDAGRTEKFSIVVSDLIHLAKECCGIVVIPIGCNVAAVSGRGSVGAFKSGDAVDRLALAFDHAETQADFFQLVASPGLRLVIESTMQPGTERREITIFQVISAAEADPATEAGPATRAGPGGGLPPRVVPAYVDSAATGRIVEGRRVGSITALGPTGRGRRPTLVAGAVFVVLLGWIAISRRRTT